MMTVQITRHPLPALAFERSASGRFQLKMGADSRILSVGTSRGAPCLFESREEGSEEVLRTFQVVASGRSLSLDGLNYIGTGGGAPDQSEFHLFEVVAARPASRGAAQKSTAP